jgi:hypothetical protein
MNAKKDLPGCWRAGLLIFGDIQAMALISIDRQALAGVQGRCPIGDGVPPETAL